MEREYVSEDPWLEALKQLQSAIDLLDSSDAPAHIAAHIDLAAHQLQDLIGSRSPTADPVQIDRNAEPH